MNHRLSWKTIAAGALLLMLITGVFSCMSARMWARLEAAVPGFSCDELRIVSTRGKVYLHDGGRVSKWGLDMPAECRARLERIVIARGYAVQPCIMGQRCYSLRGRTEAYEFTFTETGTSFRYSSY